MKLRLIDYIVRLSEEWLHKNATDVSVLQRAPAKTVFPYMFFALFDHQNQVADRQKCRSGIAHASAALEWHGSKQEMKPNPENQNRIRKEGITYHPHPCRFV